MVSRFLTPDDAPTFTFPRGLGGPMWAADERGLGAVGQSTDALRTLEACAAEAELAAASGETRALQLACMVHAQLATTFTGLGRVEDSRRASSR